MKVYLVHPSVLMYSEIYLRLEPLGLERVAAALRQAGHEVRFMDLQVFKHKDLFKELEDFKPDCVAFGLNYLANIPEVIDLAKDTKKLLPDVFIFAGGHSVSFVAAEVLEHADGAIDCILRGEGEAIAPRIVERSKDGDYASLPGIITRDGEGGPPEMIDNLEDYLPARDLLRKRKKYFIGHLDPCASIEFTRGCPWDCSFCSAWTFYGRSYRKTSPEFAAEELAAIEEPNVFIVDDVAFIRPEHGMALAEEIEKRNIKKQYYLETRGDVLIRNKEVFKRWTKLGMKYMFLGLEALDEEGLNAFRKRTTPSENFEALAVARELGVEVAINIIADPAWGPERFEAIRQWALEVPEIVHCTVQTPYPGTEIWLTEARKLTTLDYRLFDVQHAVMPTTLSLEDFYKELVKTQSVLAKKHLGWGALKGAAGIAIKLAAQGQFNFIRMLWKFSQVYNAERQIMDHRQPVKYEMRPPMRDANGEVMKTVSAKNDLYVHLPVLSGV